MDEQIPSDLIDNDETLYRSVPVGRNWVKFINGTCTPSSQAFNDREREPSVDRALLLSSTPSNAKMNPTDGVLQLNAGSVRQETVVKIEKQTGGLETKTVLTVDVVSDPTVDRPAHAKIKFHPVPGGSSNFDKLKERLALLACWAPGAEIDECR